MKNIFSLASLLRFEESRFPFFWSASFRFDSRENKSLSLLGSSESRVLSERKPSVLNSTLPSPSLRIVVLVADGSILVSFGSSSTSCHEDSSRFLRLDIVIINHAIVIYSLDSRSEIVLHPTFPLSCSSGKAPLWYTPPICSSAGFQNSLDVARYPSFH